MFQVLSALLFIAIPSSAKKGLSRKWRRRGKARNILVPERKRRITGTGGKDKTMVMGILEGRGEARTVAVENPRQPILQGEVKRQVQAGAALYSDMKDWSTEYAHQVINHALQYVDGRVHT